MTENALTFPGFTRVADVPDASIARFADAVPAPFVEFWRTSGVGLLDGGFLRSVDPAEFADLLPDVIADSEGAVALFTTAFGDIVFWRSGYVRAARLRHGVIEVITKLPGLLPRFFADPEYVADALAREPFDEACERLGVPDPDECFGYVPLLALGGPETADHLQRVALREHLLLIASVAGPVEG